jgi:RimJ/RimL family protein N-acetyltransferase
MDKMDVQIINMKEQPPNEDEIRMIAELEHHPEIRRWDTDIHDENIEKMFEAFKKFFAKLPQDEDQEVLIAKVEGRVVGFLGIHRLSKRLAHIGDVGIMVHPIYQGKGIGTKLLRNAFEVAKKMGLKRLEADTLAGNIAMIKTAHKFGFQVEGIREMRIQKDGKYEDEMLMALILDETCST